MQQLQDVSNILWRERNLLELLAFKLDSERLLARAGRTRWLPRADHEVESVLGALKAVELERSIQMHALVEELGLDADADAGSAGRGRAARVVGHLRRSPARVAGAGPRRRPLRASQPPRSTTTPPAVIALSAPSDDRGAVAVSRAVADIVAPPREQTADTGTRTRAVRRRVARDAVDPTRSSRACRHSSISCADADFARRARRA